MQFKSESRHIGLSFAIIKFMDKKWILIALKAHLAILMSLLLTSVDAFSSSSGICLELFKPFVTEPKEPFQETSVQLATARRNLSEPTLQNVDDYLQATGAASRETYRYLEQIRKESKLKLYSEKIDKVPNIDEIQAAILNEEAPLFYELASLIFPKNFKPNRAEDWTELKNKLLQNFPIYQVISFLKQTEKTATGHNWGNGDHLFVLVQKQFRDLVIEVFPHVPAEQRLSFLFAIETQLNRLQKNPLLSKELHNMIQFLNIYSERIQLVLLGQWIYYFGDRPLLDADEKIDRHELKKSKKSYRQSLEKTLIHQLGLAQRYSPEMNSQIYWLLSAHPEILKFVLNPKIRLPAQANTFLRQILIEVTQGKVDKKDFGLVLDVIRYFKNFELEAELLIPALEVISRTRGVYPHQIRWDANELLRELKNSSAN